jgi:hypothetical protein
MAFFRLLVAFLIAGFVLILMSIFSKLLQIK